MSQTQESESNITANVPVYSPPNVTLWYFQKVGAYGQDLEYNCSKYMNEHKFSLCLFYIMLFACSISRIFLYSYLLTVYSEVFSTKGIATLVLDCCLSGVYLFYCVIKLICKLHQMWFENNTLSLMMYTFFCIKYFSVCYWSINALLEFVPTKYFIWAIVLYILYAFLTEKSPAFIIIIIYVILVCFIFELIIRVITCNCQSPWVTTGEKKFITKKVPVVPYDKQQHERKLCAICLKDYIEHDSICQLSCHETHIFHSECLKEWLKQNYYCPYCRTLI